MLLYYLLPYLSWIVSSHTISPQDQPIINNCKCLLPLHENKGITMHLIKHLQLVEQVRLASCSFLLTDTLFGKY